MTESEARSFLFSPKRKEKLTKTEESLAHSCEAYISTQFNITVCEMERNLSLCTEERKQLDKKLFTAKQDLQQAWEHSEECLGLSRFKWSEQLRRTVRKTDREISLCIKELRQIQNLYLEKIFEIQMIKKELRSFESSRRGISGKLENDIKELLFAQEIYDIQVSDGVLKVMIDILKSGRKITSGANICHGDCVKCQNKNCLKIDSIKTD
ncbi:MAG: hypothetical protein KAI71_00845 [Candidatus Pacebacteria bacterium]|nr:hypothetical protein [Candidatus Paceibacterota bacterium]